MKDILTLSLLFSLLQLSKAADITQMLNQYPEFSTFNSYLTQTNLVAEVNSRQTITILVVDNAAVSSLSAKPLDQLKNILSVHIVLDYYDVLKLQQLSGNSALLTTLFQSTGSGLGQQGFLNVTRLPSGSITFGSAMPGSPLGSNLVKSFISQPYNISVVQISNPIIPQGIDGSKVSAPPSTTPAATVATPPPPASAATSPQTQSAGAAAPPPPASVIPPAISQLITPATAPPQPGAATVQPRQHQHRPQLPLHHHQPMLLFHPQLPPHQHQPQQWQPARPQLLLHPHHRPHLQRLVHRAPLQKRPHCWNQQE